VDNFRHDLGPTHRNKTPELIHREFVDGIQGRVQLRGELIALNIYGFAQQKARDPDILASEEALRRAARRALEIGLQTGTAVFVLGV